MNISVRWIVLIMLSLCTVNVAAQMPPSTLLPADLSTQDTDIETISDGFPGILLVPHSTRVVIDDRYSQPFHLTCYVYAGEGAAGSASAQVNRYLRRFAIHAPDVQSLPLARRVARLLLLLYGEERQRLRYDHPYHQTVHVWLMPQGGQGQSADAGGEQFKDQIYIYQIYAERRPIEWTREVAHEYGHYSLPGVTGFTAPEAWANGVLGERLLLKWLWDDLRAGRLQPDQLPFVTPGELEDYIARQVTPLIQRIAQDAEAIASALTRRDATGMDSYTGLALYIDAVYGSPALLSALLYTEPKPGSPLVEAPDFLHGALAALRNATELHITPPLSTEGRPSQTFTIYLPAGAWKVTTQGPVKAWRIAGDVSLQSKGHLVNHRAAWRRLTLIPTQSSALLVRLVLRKNSGQ